MAKMTAVEIIKKAARDRVRQIQGVMEHEKPFGHISQSGQNLEK